MLTVMGKRCLEVSPWALLISVHSKFSRSTVGLWWPYSRCSKHSAERYNLMVLYEMWCTICVQKKYKVSKEAGKG